MRENAKPPHRVGSDEYHRWLKTSTAFAENNQAYECLVSMDDLLREYNLQVVIWDCGYSDIIFSVEKCDWERWVSG